MRRGTALFLLLLTLLAGCGGQTRPEPREPQPAPTAKVDSRISTASVRFGIGLLTAVYQQKPGENLFLSPASASLILALTANGAAGETQREMLAALGYGEMGIAEINQGNGALQTILAHPDPKVELTMANAIWYQKGLQVAPAFGEVARVHYRAEMAPTAFGTAESVDAINRWTAQATRGKIERLLEQTDSDTAMLLVNALYFKGAWQKPFEPALTRERLFHRADGVQKQVPFMQRSATFGYLKEEGVTGVRLPYGEGRLSFYAFMPDGWEGSMEGLTPERWEGWVAAMKPQEIRLSMPKVKLKSGAELAKPLQSLGMQRAFQVGAAEFGGLFSSSRDLFVGRVVQKTYLEINEQGTEAAAATGVVVAPTSAPVEPPPEVVLDHPFLLAIRDDQTGVTLFMGAVLEP